MSRVGNLYNKIQLGLSVFPRDNFSATDIRFTFSDRRRDIRQDTRPIFGNDGDLNRMKAGSSGIPFHLHQPRSVVVQGLQIRTIDGMDREPPSSSDVA